MNESILAIIVLLFIISSTESGSPPVISEHPLDILVAKGDPATLRCGTTDDTAEITWYKDSEKVKVGNGHRLLLPNGSLFLLKVNSGGTDSDAGTYYCAARNEFGEVRSQEANVRVAMLRDEFRVNPHAVQALIGNRISLECSPPKGYPEPIVTWRKDEKELDIHANEKFHQSPDGSLIIENAQRSDAGFYQCVATSMVGERISKPARLSVFEKPKFMSEPKNIVAEVNTSVLFECRVIGEPIPSISWKKRDGQMPIGRAYVARDRGGLRIDRVQPDDAGEYVCLAKNPVGNVESSAHLKVNAPPIFTKLPENLRLNPGKTAIFECEASGQPVPGIFWSKEGDQLFTFFSGLVSSDGRIQVTKEGRLIIDDIRSFDQGNYVCAAVNSAGSTLAKASLTIIGDAASSYPPPIIQYGHQNQTLMLNDMAILPCQATGRVSVRINWLKDGLELDLNASDHKGRFRQLPVGTLQISDLRKEDTGIYTCRARNEDGEASWTASLLVEEHTNQETVFHRMPDAAALPSPPGQPRALNVSEDSVELEWTVPERHGVSPIIGYILQYWSPQLGGSWQNVLEVVPISRFRVKNARPGHSYVFVARAENAKGIGLPSLFSDMITTKQGIEGREHRTSRMLDLETARQRLASEQLVKLLEVRPLNATAMLLSWKRQKKEPLVQGFYIKWRGPPLAQDHSWLNITDSDADHIVINGLRPFTNYEFFVIPYHQQVQGMPSNSLDGTTAEAPPSMPPSDVRLRMLNVTSLRVSWRPPPPDHVNGILKGFLINIRSNHSSVEDRNISTNERATSVTLYRLIPNASYAIRVAARTNAGVGMFFNGEPVVMNEDTLLRHVRLYERADSTWYKQPWVVLGSGIVLWCLMLLAIVLFWYRCCNRSRAEERSKKERDFIKIRDGSVCAPNSAVLGEARNNFWAAHNQHFAGQGTVETFSGTLARTAGGHHQIGHPQHAHCNYSDYGSSCCNGNAAGMVQLLGQPNCASTLQRINDGYPPQAHSPSQHYHYAQLPAECDQSLAEPNSTGTFFQEQNPPRTGISLLLASKAASPYAKWDDPSPYATTTLVSPMDQTLRGGVGRGPALPLKPAPKEPPKNFLSSGAVMRTTIDGHGHLEQQPPSSSCGALFELQPEQQQRITAVTIDQQQPQQRRNRHNHQQQGGMLYGTAGRMKRSARSNSASTSRQQSSFSSLRRQKNGQLQQQQQPQQQESPQTDISYIQSSDGTNGSGNRQTGRTVDEAPEYDPVMTESLHQQMAQENMRRRKGRERRTSRQSGKNRVSLIEDEEQAAEYDPLMAAGDVGERKEAEEGLEADGELSEQSDEYVCGGMEDRRKGGPPEQKEQYYVFSPAASRPTRQPSMGVSASSLTVAAESYGNGGRRSTRR